MNLMCSMQLRCNECTTQYSWTLNNGRMAFIGSVPRNHNGMLREQERVRDRETCRPKMPVILLQSTGVNADPYHQSHPITGPTHPLSKLYSQCYLPARTCKDRKGLSADLAWLCPSLSAQKQPSSLIQAAVRPCLGSCRVTRGLLPTIP